MVMEPWRHIVSISFVLYRLLLLFFSPSVTLKLTFLNLWSSLTENQYHRFEIIWHAYLDACTENSIWQIGRSSILWLHSYYLSNCFLTDLRSSSLTWFHFVGSDKYVCLLSDTESWIFKFGGWDFKISCGCLAVIYALNP